MELLKFIHKKKLDKDEKKLENIPVHVAIIMDGNGRWAKKRNMPRVIGHRAGVETVHRIVKISSNLGIKILTLYTFSTENWKRPADEISALMSLLVEYLKKEINELMKNKVKIITIGNISKLPKFVQDEINRAVDRTKSNDGLVLNIALNYGGRSDIVNAARNLAEMAVKNKIKPEDIDEKLFEKYLYTSNIPDPDLVIRTSGEYRLSNFLLYQIAYSELWFTDTYWPDFNEEVYIEALLSFQKRNRRFGDISVTGRNE